MYVYVCTRACERYGAFEVSARKGGVGATVEQMRERVTLLPFHLFIYFSSPSLLPFSEAHRLRVHVPGKSARAMHQLMHVWLVPLLHDPAARRCFLSRYVGCLKCKERAREREGDREREGVFFAPCARCAHEGKCG